MEQETIRSIRSESGSAIAETPLMLTLCQCAGDEPFINEEPLKLIETLGRFGKTSGLGLSDARNPKDRKSTI
jgi:hypothetical protein